VHRVVELLNVLLVEDDREECDDFERVMDSIEDILLIGVTNNEKDALAYVKDHLPDAVILDLELHRGSGNGISFLEVLKKARMNYAPYILVTTHNISRITHERVRQLGADFVMVKSQDGYCAEYVLDFLRLHKQVIHDMRKKTRGKYDFIEKAPFEKRKRQEARVTTEVDKIGISPKALGRAYLIDAIMHRIAGQQDQVAEVARKYGKTGTSVERAMQNAIDRAWSTTHPEELIAYYTSRIHSERGVPTVTEFVYYYANKVKADYLQDF